MIEFIIKNPALARDAVFWCFNNVSADSWTLDCKDAVTNSPKYSFFFDEQRDAVLFALKWASAN